MAGTSQATAVANKEATQRGAGSSQAAKAARDLAPISEAVTAAERATSRDPWVLAGIGTEQKGSTPMEQESAPGERVNKTPLFMKGVSNARSFLRWLKEKTGGDGSARIQGEKLVLVPNTADCFRATVKELRYMEPSGGMAFHTYSLPEDRCTRLLVKGLGKNMPE